MATHKHATYADVVAAPPHCVAQLIDGELHVHPRPAGPHAVFTSGLGADLTFPFQRGRGGPGGWVFVDEPELHFGPNVIVPDLAGWRAERVPDLTAAHFSVAPDWVCEVLSPRTARLDRGRKADLYAREGVAFLWLASPEEHFIEAFSREGEHWLRRGVWLGDEPARIPPFDAVELDLAPLWVTKLEE